MKNLFLITRHPSIIDNVNFAFFALLLATSVHSDSNSNHKESSHSRQKRFLWITTDGRLALPPGTTLVISPSLSMPFVRYPPDGFFSNMTISLPFTIDFNKLGLTDNENPYGVAPPIFSRSMGRAAGNLLADYIGSVLSRSRGKRSTLPSLPKEHTHAFHGGERALLYGIVEEFLENFGMNGRACLLRAICEVHAHPLSNFGLFGEMLKLFLTASSSPFADLMEDYVEAEKTGRGFSGGPGECWPYMKECPKSLFLFKDNRFSRDSQESSPDSLDEENSTESQENEIYSGKNRFQQDENRVTLKQTKSA